MQPTSEHRVFVDANVLASPVPRTILYLSQPLSDFQLVLSPWVEREAERHQKTGHIPVSTLRQRFDWEFVPDADDSALFEAYRDLFGHAPARRTPPTRGTCRRRSSAARPGQP